MQGKAGDSFIAKTLWWGSFPRGWTEGTSVFCGIPNVGRDVNRVRDSGRPLTVSFFARNLAKSGKIGVRSKYFVPGRRNRKKVETIWTDFGKQDDTTKDPWSKQGKREEWSKRWRDEAVPGAGTPPKPLSKLWKNAMADCKINLSVF